MSRQELAKVARQAALELEAAGWDYDDARFATMAMVNTGVLSEQLAGITTPALDELKAEWAKVDKSVPERNLSNVRVSSTNEMEDQ